MSTQEFSCYDCGIYWHDQYTFWNSYLSRCPQCDRLCEATRDVQAREDNRSRGLSLGLPAQRDEEDIEAERSEIRDEIVEALAYAAAENQEAGETDAMDDAEGSDDF